VITAIQSGDAASEDAVDWRSLSNELDAEGYAILPRFVDASTSDRLTLLAADWRNENTYDS
jgi:hypothetical protein